MDIAAMSIVLNQGKMQQKAGISVLKMSMGVAADQGNSIDAMANDSSKAMELSIHPYLGANLDILV